MSRQSQDCRDERLQQLGPELFAQVLPIRPDGPKVAAAADLADDRPQLADVVRQVHGQPQFGGPLVADAIHYYINSHVKSGTDVSMVAVGVIRDRIMPGFQSAPNIVRIMSMGMGNHNIPGYPLATLYVTGKELKSILEILQVAYKSTPANYCYYSGIRVEYDPQKGMLKKISRIEIVRPDGTKRNVDFSKRNGDLYAVTANSYMLQFIGIIKKMSFGLINVVPKDEEGNPEYSQLACYLVDFSDFVQIQGLPDQVL